MPSPRRGERAVSLALILLTLLLGLLNPAGGRAAESAALSAEQIEARIKEVEGQTGLDDAQRARLAELYRQALAQLEAVKKSESLAGTYRAAVESAPRETRAIRDALAKPAPAEKSPLPAGVGPDTPLPELEQRLARQKVDLTGVEARLAGLEKQLQEQQGRPGAVRQELAEARRALEALGQEDRAPVPAGESAAATDARKVLQQTRLAARSAEVVRLEQELASHPVRLELLNAQRDQTAREASAAQDAVRRLDELVNQGRRVAAAIAVQQTARAEQAAEAKHPAIRRLAEANAHTGAALAALTSEAEEVNALREATETRVAQLEQDFQSARQKLEVAGLSQALGKVLMEQRNRLPDQRRVLRGETPPLALAHERQRRLGEVGLEQVQVADERRQVADVGRAVERTLTEQVSEVHESAQREAIREELTRLLKDRQQLLQQLGTAQGDYLRELGELEFVQKRLEDTSGAFRQFLDEHLLWIPSQHPLGARTPGDLLAAVGWLFSIENWWGLLVVVGHELVAAPALAALTAFGIGALAWGGIALRRRVAEHYTLVGRPNSDRFVYTVEGLLDTLLLAVPLPLLMWLTGRALQFSPEATDFTQAVGSGLRGGAPFLLNTSVFLRLCSPGGVAAVHFRWPDPLLRQLRRQLRSIVTIGLPLALLAATFGTSTSEAYRAGLSRVAFMGMMVLFAVILQRLLRPDGALMQSYFAAHPNGWLFRLRRLWPHLAVGMSLGLALLAAVGYYYSAGHLARRMVDTVWLFMGAAVVQSLVVRWLTLTRSRLALQLARERREAALAAREARAGGAEPAPAPAEAFGVDLAAVDAQTRKLLRTVILLALPVGLWLIWADVLPALNVLERVELWHQTQVIDGQERVVPVTLQSLFLALLVAVVATAAAHNLPGLLDLAIFRHASLEPGVRYAISKATGYAIAAAGALLAFGVLGLSWAQVQWLVAALGVGLGFGLQEIFANFISGLIILFERPVRVGDTVTVGELTGTVSRIRIRATTITDFDRKEIIVPNKSFITERVVNWTLTDAVTRVRVQVGVAYGSDPEKALRVILRAVRSVPKVRSEPEPRVFFMGFGDSALDFDVYVFASELADRLPIVNDIHVAVERALREEGIEIPFPQRDIHIRSAPWGFGSATPVALAPGPSAGQLAPAPQSR